MADTGTCTRASTRWTKICFWPRGKATACRNPRWRQGRPPECRADAASSPRLQPELHRTTMHADRTKTASQHGPAILYPVISGAMDFTLETRTHEPNVTVLALAGRLTLGQERGQI